MARNPNINLRTVPITLFSSADEAGSVLHPPIDGSGYGRRRRGVLGFSHPRQRGNRDKRT